MARWIGNCSIGEGMGIAVVAVAYAAAGRGLVPEAPAVLAAGLWEGLCLGVLQARLLASRGVRPLRWILATAFGAVLGYGLSLLGGAGGAESAAAPPPAWLLLTLAAALGAAMGVLMGAAQWLAARDRLRPAAWIGRNALGWALGMPAIFAGSALASETMPLAAIAGLGGVSGALAGALVGWATRPALPARQGTG